MNQFGLPLYDDYVFDCPLFQDKKIELKWFFELKSKTSEEKAKSKLIMEELTSKR